eukprot:COSAG01_NODE_18739_length_1056_cov_1.077325_1_plen_157_part_10
MARLLSGEPGSRTAAAAAAMILGAGLVVLGLASYGWWGSQLLRASDLDHFMMEAHTLALAVYFLALATPRRADAIIGVFVVFLAMRRLMFGGRAELVYASVAAFSCALVAVSARGGSGSGPLFVAGMSLSLGGFVPKCAWRFFGWPVLTGMYRCVAA